MDYSSGTKLYTHPKLQVTIEYFNGNPYIKEVWQGIFNPIVFRDLIRNTLNIYEKHLSNIRLEHQNKFFLFGDASDLELIHDKDIIWFNEVIYHRYEALGFTHHAIIQPTSQYASGKVEDVNTDESYEPFKVKVFEEESAAFEWLLKEVKNENKV
jgi:hypothetical protein